MCIPATLSGPEANSGGTITRIAALPLNGTLFQTSDGVTAGEQITGDDPVITNSDGKVIFRPALNGNGNPYTTFQFAIAHGVSALEPGHLPHPLITPLPDAPLAVNDVFTVAAGSLVKLTPLANDSEADGDAMTMTSHTLPSTGTLVKNVDGSFDFSADPLSGSTVDSFTYTLTDAGGLKLHRHGQTAHQGASPNAWPTLGGDPDHRGDTPVTLGTSTLSQQWSVNLGGILHRSPLRGGGCSSPSPFTSPIPPSSAWMPPPAVKSGGKVTAMRPVSTPPTRVRRKSARASSGRPGQTLYLAAFDDADGTVEWSSLFRQQWEHYLAPAVDETGVYVAGGSYGGMYGFDSDTGAQKFSLACLSMIAGHRRCMRTDSLIPERRSPQPHAATGVVQWTKDTLGYGGNSTAACAEKMAYVVTVGSNSTRQLTRVNLTTRANVWSYTRGFDSMTGTPAVGPNSVFVLANREVVELDKTTGNVLRTTRRVASKISLPSPSSRQIHSWSHRPRILPVQLRCHPPRARYSLMAARSVLPPAASLSLAAMEECGAMAPSMLTTLPLLPVPSR